MLAVFLETLPFFGLIALGFGAGRIGFFSAEATGYLTRFVFYFALSALLFQFTSGVALGEIFDGPAMVAYLAASAVHWGLMVSVALFRRHSLAAAGFEGHTAVHGNIGFLGIPLLGSVLGSDAIAVIVLLLFVDMVVFGTLVVALVSLGREGRITSKSIGAVWRGLVTNPMILSILAGLFVSATGVTIPEPGTRMIDILGAAATPGALFAIGCSLAYKRIDDPGTAVWLSLGKILLHPFFVFVTAFLIWPVEPFTAGVMVAAASLPVAGNIYLLAQHYGVFPERVSAAILISTAASIVTVPVILSWVVP